MKRPILLVFLTSLAASQPLPFAIDRTSASVLTIGTGCTRDTPCNVRIGSVVQTILSSATVTLTAGTGTAYVYISPNGQLTVGHDLQIKCDGCAAAPGVKSFPSDSIPLWMWPASNGKWDSKGTDMRAGLSTSHLTADNGIVLTRKPGETRIGLSPALLTRRADVPKTASSPCTDGDWAVDTQYVYFCIAPNQWRRAALAAW
jgi:hypothetical protein